MTLRSTTQHLILNLQSRGWRLPPSVRSLARRAVARVGAVSHVPDLAGWDTPLVAGRRVVPLPTRTPNGPDLPAAADIPRALPRTTTREHATTREQKRCLILTDVLDVGGVDELVALLARRLPHAGWSVDVVKTGTPGGYLATRLQDEGIGVCEAPSPAQFESVLRIARADVISAHAPALWALEAAQRWGVPVVETLHGAPTPLTSDWIAEPVRASYITAFVAVSQQVRRHYLAGNPGYPPDAVVAIPIGYDATARPSQARGPARAWLGLRDEFVFTSLGRLSAEKNTYGLVAAFAEMAAAESNCHLLVGGRVDDPTYAHHVLRLIGGQPRHVQARIHLRGNTNEVAAVLAASDCFVMDSFYEGWGMASVEALAAGIPVIRSETGGAIEQVGDARQRGYMVANPLGSEAVNWESISWARFIDQANKGELVGAMRAAYEDRHIWAARRDALSTEAANLFPLSECVERHNAVLAHAARHPGPGQFANHSGATNGPF